MNEGYSFEDVCTLATKQAELIHRLNSKPGLKVVDSDMIVFEVWFLERFNKLPDNWEEIKLQGRVDLHLLCKPDIPWEADPIRENESDRDRLFQQYLRVFRKNRFIFEIIEGVKDARFSRCLEFLNKKKAAH